MSLEQKGREQGIGRVRENGPTKEAILSGSKPTNWGGKWLSRQKWVRSRSFFEQNSFASLTKTRKSASKWAVFSVFLAVFGAKWAAFWLGSGISVFGTAFNSTNPQLAS
jgi:hypothetical protein